MSWPPNSAGHESSEQSLELLLTLPSIILFWNFFFSPDFCSLSHQLSNWVSSVKITLLVTNKITVIISIWPWKDPNKCSSSRLDCLQTCPVSSPPVECEFCPTPSFYKTGKSGERGEQLQVGNRSQSATARLSQCLLCLWDCLNSSPDRDVGLSELSSWQRCGTVCTLLLTEMWDCLHSPLDGDVGHGVCCLMIL